MSDNPVTDRAREAADRLFSLEDVHSAIFEEYLDIAASFERDIRADEVRHHAGQSVGDYVLVPREQIEKLANKQDGYGMAYHAKGIGSNGSAEIHLYGKRAEAAHWLMQNGLSLAATPASDSPAIPEPRGWKCNACQSVFTDAQQERRESDSNGGPRCPYCKADGQYTYPYALHKGDPCERCDVAHDDVAPGPCQGSKPTPASHTAPDAGDDGGPVDSKAKQIGDANGDPNWWRYIAQARKALANPTPSRDEVAQRLTEKLLQFTLRCSSSNPASLGSAVNDAESLLIAFGIEPRDRGVFWHTDAADLADARSRLAALNKDTGDVQ